MTNQEMRQQVNALNKVIDLIEIELECPSVRFTDNERFMEGYKFALINLERTINQMSIDCLMKGDRR